MECGGDFSIQTSAGYVKRRLLSNSSDFYFVQSEVLHSHPAASVPKNNLKAPPLDPANPTSAHAWLPVPSTSAKLKSASGATASGAATSPPDFASAAPTAPHSTLGPQILGRFPPTSRTLSERDLDPYFINFEASTRELELLLQGNIEKVNRRTLAHLSSLSADLMELGSRYNGFSLSEQSPTVAAAIERIGQAADTSYIETEELSSSLSASFAEPMRESAQFASIVRSVLRYRVLKRVQEEMTRDELARKKSLLDSLERSELEAKRIEQYLNNTSVPSTKPKRSMSASSAGSSQDRESDTRRSSAEDTASIDSDFPPTHGDALPPHPSTSQGSPQRGLDQSTASTANTPVHRKSSSGNFVTNKIFGRISHAVHGFVDVDPERTRRDQIGKTKESLVQVRDVVLCAILAVGTELILNLLPVVGASARDLREGRQGCQCRGAAGSEAVSEGKGGRPSPVHGMCAPVLLIFFFGQFPSPSFF